MKLQNVHKPLVIFALNTGHREAVEKELSAVITGDNTVHHVLGCYKGECENSWMAELKSGRLEAIKYHLGNFDQESMLVLDEYRNTRLVFMDGREDVHLGKFKQCSKREALASNNCTYEPLTGRYFLAG